MTAHLTAWYSQSSLVALLVTSALAVWGFRASVGGQKLFTGAALEK